MSTDSNKNNNNEIDESMTSKIWEGTKNTFDIDEILKNTINTTIDWKKRESSIKKLGQICLGDQIEIGRASCRERV